MNIAVLIKQVPVSNDVSVDPETHALVRASSEGMINPADLNAIEEAMQLKEQTDGKVVVLRWDHRMQKKHCVMRWHSDVTKAA